jgi:hypothetical protein
MLKKKLLKILKIQLMKMFQKLALEKILKILVELRLLNQLENHGFE